MRCSRKKQCRPRALEAARVSSHGLGEATHSRCVGSLCAPVRMPRLVHVRVRTPPSVDVVRSLRADAMANGRAGAKVGTVAARGVGIRPAPGYPASRAYLEGQDTFAMPIPRWSKVAQALRNPMPSYHLWNRYATGESLALQGAVARHLACSPDPLRSVVPERCMWCVTTLNCTSAFIGYWYTVLLPTRQDLSVSLD